MTSGDRTRTPGGLVGLHSPDGSPPLCCIVAHMDHLTWVSKHDELSRQLADVHGRRDELGRHSAYIPGPVFQKRDRALIRRELHILDQLEELQRLDRDGAVS